jgi:hypothetical protein
VHLDARSLLALLVGNLPDVSVDLFDSKARSGLKIPAVLDLGRPLIASGKLQVLERFHSVAGFGIAAQAQELDRFLNPWIVVKLAVHPIHPAFSNCCILGFRGFRGSLTIRPIYLKASAPWLYSSCRGDLLKLPYASVS